MLDSLFEKVKDELGYKRGGLEADLQKLVLLEEGGQLGGHLEIQSNEDKNFITMMVQLPSLSTGNSLFIHFGDQIRKIQFDRENAEYETLYAAFYSTCEYEMTLLESGYRLMLVYRLSCENLSESLDKLDESKEKIQEIAETLSKVK